MFECRVTRQLVLSFVLLKGHADNRDDFSRGIKAIVKKIERLYAKLLGGEMNVGMLESRHGRSGSLRGYRLAQMLVNERCIANELLRLNHLCYADLIDNLFTIQKN